MIHPWRRLRALTEWELVRHSRDEVSDKGFTDHDRRKISLRDDLTWAERRCTVLHECLHAEHGPVLDVHADRHENDVRRTTARLMLPSVRPIGEALAWALSPDEAADELGVDVGVLRDRLRWLHPAERHYLSRRLDEID